MRVLVVVHGFPPHAQGGSEIYAHAHAVAMHERFGDEVLVLTREQDPGREEYATRTEHRDGLEIVWVNNTFRRARTFEETYRNDVIGAIATRVIDEFQPDVAHIHHLTCLSTTIVRALACRNIPRVMTLHDYWLICHRGQLLDVRDQVCAGPEPSGCHACLGIAGGSGPVAFSAAAALRALERGVPVTRHLRGAALRVARITARTDAAENEARNRFEHMRQVCANVTHFIAPSHAMKRRFVQFGVVPEHITVSGYGASAPVRRRREQTGSTRLRVGFLGSLMISKGVHVLLEAARRLGPDRISVHLFGQYSPYHGDDSYRQTLEPLLGHDGVQLHGSVPHAEVPEALAGIDVLVVPSIWPENSPLVIHEAFLAGVPVVASDVGGIPELVIHGTNGLLFRAGDPDHLAATLMRLHQNPGLLAELSRGIPAVRTIDDDVSFTRDLYRSSITRAAATAAAAGDLAAVVLNYRTPDDTLLAVKSLLASRRTVDPLIVVDNDPAAGAREALAPVWSRITYLHAGRNLGFSGGMNVGIRYALERGARRVLLVNSDMIVPPDCIERLERGVNPPSDAAIAGPVVLSRSRPDRVATMGMSYDGASGRMRHPGCGGPVGPHVPDHRVVDAVSGCLMLVNREVFDAVGLLHDDYFFGFEDLDFCLKARRAGFRTAVAGDAVAYHEGGRAIGAQSPARLYFAARNHLLMAERAAPSSSRAAFLARAVAIVLLNIAHAIGAPGGSLPARLAAVFRGTKDYIRRRFGAGMYGSPV